MLRGGVLPNERLDHLDVQDDAAAAAPATAPRAARARAAANASCAGDCAAAAVARPCGCCCCAPLEQRRHRWRRRCSARAGVACRLQLLACCCSAAAGRRCCCCSAAVLRRLLQPAAKAAAKAAAAKAAAAKAAAAKAAAVKTAVKAGAVLLLRRCCEGCCKGCSENCSCGRGAGLARRATRASRPARTCCCCRGFRRTGSRPGRIEGAEELGGKVVTPGARVASARAACAPGPAAPLCGPRERGPVVPDQVAQRCPANSRPGLCAAATRLWRAWSFYRLSSRIRTHGSFLRNGWPWLKSQRASPRLLCFYRAQA